MKPPNLRFPTIEFPVLNKTSRIFDQRKCPKFRRINLIYKKSRYRSSKSDSSRCTRLSKCTINKFGYLRNYGIFLIKPKIRFSVHVLCTFQIQNNMQSVQTPRVFFVYEPQTLHTTIGIRSFIFPFQESPFWHFIYSLIMHAVSLRRNRNGSPFIHNLPDSLAKGPLQLLSSPLHFSTFW